MAELYRRMGESTGRQPTPFWQSLAVRPDLASSLWEWFEALMLTSGRFGRALKEMIARRVAYANAGTNSGVQGMYLRWSPLL